METLSAILLSAALLLGGLSIQESNPAAARVNAILTRIIQTVMVRAPEQPDLGKNIAATKTSAELYGSSRNVEGSGEARLCGAYERYQEIFQRNRAHAHVYR